MFQYNPTVNDRSAEILANASTNASQIQAQSMQQMGQSIGDAIASIGQGLQKRREDLAKVETSMAAGEAMMNLSQQFGPDGELFRQSFSDSLTKAGKNPDKIAGAVAAHTSVFDSLMSMKREQARMDGYKDLADYKSSLGAASTDTAPRMNAENIRSMVAEAKAAGFSDDAIKTKLQSQYGDWAVRSVYPPQNQGIWMGQ